MTNKKHKCAEIVYSGGSTAFHRCNCSFTGKYFEDGKYWCGKHLPSKVKAKEQEQREKYNAQWEVINKINAKKNLEHKYFQIFKDSLLDIANGKVNGRFIALELLKNFNEELGKI